MREYKIVEMKDGHGSPKFIIKAKYGWGVFSFWEKCSISTYNTMQEATDQVKEYIDSEKGDQRFKIKEYIYTTVPNHVPEEQLGKFMEIKKNL